MSLSNSKSFLHPLPLPCQHTHNYSLSTILLFRAVADSAIPSIAGKSPGPRRVHEFIDDLMAGSPAVTPIGTIPESPSSLQSAPPTPRIASPTNPMMKQTILSSRRLAEFLGTPKRRGDNDKVVYVDGSFDVLHSKGLDWIFSFMSRLTQML